MRKFLGGLLFALLIASNASAAKRNGILQLKSEDENVKVALFSNSDLDGVRCLCATFSAIVREPDNGMVGGTNVTEIKVIRKFENEVISETVTEPTAAIMRCPSSPWYADLPRIMAPNQKDLYVVQALKRRCMNPTVESCHEMVVVAEGQFKLRDLYKLAPMKPREALARLEKTIDKKSGDSSAGSCNEAP